MIDEGPKQISNKGVIEMKTGDIAGMAALFVVVVVAVLAANWVQSKGGILS